MKTNLLLSFFLLFSFGFVKAQIPPVITTWQDLDPNICSGQFSLDNYSDYSTWQWIDSDSSTVLSQDISWSDSLCAGTYYLFFTDTTGTYSLELTMTAGYCIDLGVFNEVFNEFYLGDCDGYTRVNGYTDPNAIAPFSYVWKDSVGTILGYDQFIDSLCVGMYIVNVTDANGCTGTDTSIVSTQNANPSFWINLDIVEATVGSCDGSVLVNTVGGQAPFQYIHSDTSTNVYRNNLCPGVYFVEVWDSTLGYGFVNYLIVEANDLIINTTYPDSLVTDTLHGQPINDCSIDFANIFSASINNTSQLGDSIQVEWLITYNNTSTITINQTYYADTTFTGIYAFTLSLICSQKAINNVLKVYDQSNFNYLSSSIEVVTDFNVKIYPNPTQNFVNIELEEKGNLKVYDLNGKSLINMKLNEITTIDLSNLDSGIYFFLIETKNGAIIRKIIRE